MLNAVLGNSVVQVWPCAAPCAADTSDCLADMNTVTFRNVDRTQMAVKGHEAVIMAQSDELSDRCSPADLRHHSSRCRINPFARVARQIYACVVFVFIQERMETGSVSGADPEVSKIFGPKWRDAGYMVNYRIRPLEQQNRLFDLAVVFCHIQ